MEKPNEKYVKENLGGGDEPVCEFDKAHGMYGGNVEGYGFQAVKPKDAKEHPPGKPFTTKGA